MINPDESHSTWYGMPSPANFLFTDNLSCSMFTDNLSCSMFRDNLSCSMFTDKAQLSMFTDNLSCLCSRIISVVYVHGKFHWRLSRRNAGCESRRGCEPSTNWCHMGLRYIAYIPIHNV
jgi:hypothetical protein